MTFIVPIIVPPRKCPGCREKVKRGAKTCHHCGYIFPPQNKAVVVALVLSLLLLILLALVLYFRQT